VIRPLTQLDEPFLREILYHALYVPEGSAPFPKEIVNDPDIAKYVTGWGKSGDLGFAAIDETSDQAIGAVWIRLFDSGNPGYGHIDEHIPELSIAMLPGYRNLGFGTQLLERMLAEAEGQSPGLSLSVSYENPARRLYKRLGFQVFKESGASLIMLISFRNTYQHDT
jgi:ribosomal protein S18 acetylase RimI-like enzyme